MCEIEKRDGKNIVRLPNDFVEAIYSLSVDAKKLFLSLCLHLNSKNEIRVHISEVEREVGIKLEHLNQRHLKKLIKEIMSKIIEIKDLENRNKWKLVALVKEVDYNEGIVTAEISKNLLPYFQLAQERLFTRFNIQNIKPLTSIHAIRMYELAKQFDDTGWREISLEEFKRMMKIEDKYKQVKDLKKRVLEPAKRQINERTDINIDYELIKQGRRYTKIRLKISKNKQRVERKENKRLIENGNFAELETKLNKQYKGKAIKGDDGLTWYVNRIKVLNEKEAEIEITNLSDTKKIVKKIEELKKIF